MRVVQYQSYFLTRTRKNFARQAQVCRQVIMPVIRLSWGRLFFFIAEKMFSVCVCVQKCFTVN